MQPSAFGPASALARLGDGQQRGAGLDGHRRVGWLQCDITFSPMRDEAASLSDDGPSTPAN